MDAVHRMRLFEGEAHTSEEKPIMSVRTISTLVLSLALMIVATPSANAAKGDKKEDKKSPIAQILKHGSELGLSAEQVTKLEALEKGPKKEKGAKKEKGEKSKGDKGLKDEVKSILTSEQLEKAKKFLEEHKKKAK